MNRLTGFKVYRCQRAVKTGHFEERIAFGVVQTAQRRDESTQRELAAFNNDFGGAWLVPRRIARELGIHRETVGRHLRLAGSKPAIPLTGSLVAGRQSLCVPLQTVIESAVQAGLSAQRIYQDLICDHAFTGGYHFVQRFVRQLLQTQPVPFVRMEVEPGMEAQVDFGQGARVMVDGKRKRPHLFRIVLSHLRGFPCARIVDRKEGFGSPSRKPRKAVSYLNDKNGKDTDPQSWCDTPTEWPPCFSQPVSSTT